jgi:hypothetical protein
LSAQAGSANNGSIQTVVFENPLGDPVSDTSTIETAVHALADLLMASQNTVFFTGAGISTESGIPDFRSPGTGLWNKIRPIEFQDFVNSAESATGIMGAKVRERCDGQCGAQCRTSGGAAMVCLRDMLGV